jgi:putative ABC transport system permease protein
MMIWRRLAFLLPWRRRAAEAEIADELRALAALAPPRELGNLTLAAEDARSELGWTRLEQAGRDVRYAIRSARRSPGFALAAVASLAIGIGANAALFSLINTILWKSLPVREAGTLMAMGRRDPNGITHRFTYDNYRVFRDHVPALTVAAYGTAPLNVSIDGQLEPTLRGHLVTGSYFPLLGLTPARGRLFGPEDDRVPGGHAVAVLSHDYWRQRFATDPGVVGRTITISGHLFTIVGVAPREFFGVEVGQSPELFLPVMMQPSVMPMAGDLIALESDVTSTWMRVLARAADGASLPRPMAQLDALAGVPETEWRLRNKFTGQYEEARLWLGPAATGFSDLRRQFSEPLFLLLGIAGMVLLVACANVGNLVLARAATRRAEFALRLALGAGRGRLVRQVIAESLVLAIPAGVAALLLAHWTARVLVRYTAIGRDAIDLDVSADWRVLVFTGLLSVVAGLALGCLPAIRASRVDRLGSGSVVDLSNVRGVGSRVGPGQTLVVVQIASSLVLLVGASLFVRSLQNLSRPDHGIDRRTVLTVRIEPKEGRSRSPEVVAGLDQAYRGLITEIEALPGVQSASLAKSSPLGDTGYSFIITRQAGMPRERLNASIVYPRYFATMGIPVVAGRDFTDDDLGPGSPRVVIVNEAFVRDVLSGASPLGAGHGVSEADRGAPPAPLNIVGVVKDSRFPALREASQPLVYQPFSQAATGSRGMTLHARLSGSDDATVGRIRAAVQAVQPDVPMFQISTLAEEVDAALVRERLVAMLSTAFGGVTLVLIGVGLYGLMAYAVARRTAEIGVRLALGATPSAIRGLVTHEAFRVLLIGLAVGIPAAWIAGRLAMAHVSPLLFGLTPGDPMSFALAIAWLVLVTVAAAVMPALRASHIDPIVALRQE